MIYRLDTAPMYSSLEGIQSARIEVEKGHKCPITLSALQELDEVHFAQTPPHHLILARVEDVEMNSAICSAESINRSIVQTGLNPNTRKVIRQVDYFFKTQKETDTFEHLVTLRLRGNLAELASQLPQIGGNTEQAKENNSSSTKKAVRQYVHSPTNFWNRLKVYTVACQVIDKDLSNDDRLPIKEARASLMRDFSKMNLDAEVKYWVDLQLADFPDDDTALEKIGDMYRRGLCGYEKNFARAYEYYEKALTINPKNQYALDRLVNILFQKEGQTEDKMRRGMAILEEAIKMIQSFF